MKTESVSEFLNRGGKIKKVAMPKTEGVKLTAFPSDKESPAFYEMDCDPNTITVPVKPDLILDSGVDIDSEDELNLQLEATETSDDLSCLRLPKGHQENKS